MRVTVVDYGMGNLGSIANMLRKLGHDTLITFEPAEILRAEKLILPGVGAFDLGMQRLEERKLIDALNEKVLNQKAPTLGICLGLQLMTRESEEGNRKGLGWLDANVVKFNAAKTSERIRVPHMGWNTATPMVSNKLLDTNDEHRFYFVHSFHLNELSPTQTLCTTHYGYEFATGATKGNIFGVQFHPEKSHRFGMRLLKNFIENV